MLVANKDLSAQALAFMEKLEALDLSLMAVYLINPQNGYGWTRPQVFRAIRRYKTFLFVNYLYPQIWLVPTQEIDHVWHCHILHTRKYRQDCDRLFGYFIDHEPESYGEAKLQNWDAAFAQTQSLLALFEDYFEATDAQDEQGLELAEEHSLLGSDGGKGDLHLARSACGRPSR